MSNSEMHQLKQVYTEMKALRNKESGGLKLTRGEQTQLDQLATEYHELLTDTLLHTY